MVDLLGTLGPSWRGEGRVVRLKMAPLMLAWIQHSTGAAGFDSHACSPLPQVVGPASSNGCRCAEAASAARGGCAAAARQRAVEPSRVILEKVVHATQPSAGVTIVEPNVWVNVSPLARPAPAEHERRTGQDVGTVQPTETHEKRRRNAQLPKSRRGARLHIAE